MGASATHVEAVSKAWRDYAKAEGLAQKSSEWTKTQRDAVRAWESVTVSAIRSVRSEETSLARMRAQLSAEATRDAERAAAARARAVEREMAAMRRQAERQREAMSRMGFGHFVLGSAAAAVSAHGIFSITEKGLEAGAERQHVRIGMHNASMSWAEISKAERAAQEAARGAPNMSISEIMELHKEARSAVRDPEEVFKLIGPLARAGSILRGMGVDNANLGDIVKGAESLGLFNTPGRFEKYLHGQVAAMSVMGKTITTEQIYEAAKYSKSAGATLSDEFLNLVMPSLIQEMHGSSAGDALSMMGKTLRGGLQRRHLAVEMLNKIGMLADPSKIKRSKTGEIIGYSGKLIGDQYIASDPDKFAAILDKHFEQHGYKSLADKTAALQLLPSTAANLLRILIQQAPALAAHRRSYLAVPDDDTLVANQKGDPIAAVTALRKGLDDLGAAVTDPMMQRVGTTLSWLAEQIRAVESVAKDHPTAAATAGGVAAGVSLAGSGWLGYKVMTGFGLPSAASHLEIAATKLEIAAGELGADGLGAGGKGGKGGWKSRLLKIAKGAAVVGTVAELGELLFDLRDKSKDGWRASPPPTPKGEGHWEYFRGGRHWRDAQGNLHATEMDGKRASDELYGPFRRWQVTGRGSGRWMLDTEVHHAAAEVQKLSARTLDLVAQFASLSDVTTNLAAAMAAIGGSSGGGGLINASYETSGGGGALSRARWGNGGGAVFGGSNAAFPSGTTLEKVRQYIRERAAQIGIDPNIAERVARSEGLNRSLGAGGDGGTSDGPFQLHVGGGLGDAYQRLTGHSIHDKRFWQDQVDFALNAAKRGGWAPWHGWHGSPWAGIDRHHRSDPLGLRNRRSGSPAHHEAAKLIQALDGASASPGVDASGVHAFIRAVRLAKAELADLHGIGTGGTGRPRVPGLGATMRGAFTHSGMDFG